MSSSDRESGGAPEGVRRVSAVVVAGTHVRLARLAHLLGLAGVEALGVAKSPDEAEALVCALRPDAVLLDLALGAGGIEAVERIMARCATPVVVTGGAAESASLALAAGAVDVVAPGTEALGPTAYAAALGRHLHVASRVRVITHPRARLRERGLDIPAPSTGVRDRGRRHAPVVVIGASTGGPPALATVLGGLPTDLAASVVVVQHMAEGFVEGLALWLDGVVGLPVSVALSGDRLRPGHVVLAPSDGNLVIEPTLRLRVEDPRPGQFHVPEINGAFRSVAQACGERAVGVLLTGMGRDGAEGMLALRNAGAFTIAQDEGTSAVWGMPAAAAALDAVSLELALPDIAEGIIGAVSRVRVPEAV